VLADSESTLLQALAVLGGAPSPRDLDLMAPALLAGPADLAAELRAAGAGGPDGEQAFNRLTALLEERGAFELGLTLLDLVTVAAVGSRALARPSLENA
jgi:hypothetical protein